MSGGRRICGWSGWVEGLEERRLMANLGGVDVYLVDHATGQRVENPAAGTEVELHARFVAEGVATGTVVRVQRETENGTVYTDTAAPAAWAGRVVVERNLFTWTVPPVNAWVKVSIDPKDSVAESDEGDNSATVSLSPAAAVRGDAVPAYHSLAGAKAALYLDFDGYYQAEFAGSRDVATPAYDSDGNPLVLSGAEREEIRQIWARVAEDYAPFNIDVTTEEPGTGVRYQRVAIGGASCDWYEFSGAGTGVPGSFAATDGACAAFAFVEQANGDGTAMRFSIATIADTASHEAGHAFGLLHQARYDDQGNLVSEYNAGSGDWGPIMGKSGNGVSTWFDGRTVDGAGQDDMAIIGGAANGFGWRGDDVGDDAAHAKSLGVFAGEAISAAGVIGTNSDVDVYSVTVPGGTYRVGAEVAADGANLDAVIEVRDAAGNVVGSANPAGSQSASVDVVLAAGTYYVAVRSTGVYGWVGQYLASVGTVPVAQAAAGPVGVGAMIAGAVPKSVAAGASGVVGVSVSNAGVAAAKGAVVVKVYAAVDREMNGGGVLLGRVVVKKLAGKGRRRVEVPVVFGKGLGGRSYYLVAVVGQEVRGSGGKVRVLGKAVRGEAMRQ